MPIRATFLADFSSFQSAVQKAELSLRSFETGGAKVEKQLNSMANAFSGQKTLQQATLMAASVEKLGGVSGLTKAELQRVSSTMQEAIEKAKAMGVEIPPEIAKIGAEARRAQIGFKEMATAAAAIGAVVAGAAAGIAKLGERGAEVNDVRDSFQGLTAQIGETSDAILGRLREATLGTVSDTELMKTANLGLSQGLKLTAEQFGTTGDVAAVLADRIGGDVKTSFDTLVQAMATGQDRTLKTIGLNIDAARATEQYAASIGKTVGQLTEEERKTAVKNAILAEGERILRTSGKAQEDFGDKVAQSSTKLSNFVDKVGSWIATSPSIGAWTSTITAASSTVTAFGLAFGPVSAGISKLIPLLGLSGLGGTFAALGTTITATVIPALGTALAALAPFALPLAALATAVGVVYLAWKNWDTITAFVKGVYEGVKTWMMGKLTAIFDYVKGKIDMVTGAFKDMYDKVVGNSFVPDMVDGISAEFARLQSVMVDPTVTAQQKVTDVFGFMQSSVNTIVGNMVGDIEKRLQGLVTSVMPKWGSNLTGSLGSIASSAIGVFSGLLTGGISAALSAVSGLLMKGLGWIGGKISSFFSGIGRGGVIGTQVNPARDQWFNQFGSGSVQDVGDALGKVGIDGNKAAEMIKAVFDAKSMEQLQSTTGAIDKLLGQGFRTGEGTPSFATGTGGKYVDFGPGTLAMLHGKEKITPMGGESSQPLHIHVNVDGREIAWALVPHLPDAQAALA